MKYVLLFVGTMEDQERFDSMPSEEMAAGMKAAERWFEEYSRAGKIVGGEQLKGPQTVTTVRFEHHRTALGIGVRRCRLAALVVAAVFGAIGGVLLVVPTGLADPLLAYWTHSGNLVFMLLLGGFDHFLGPVLGALVFILLQDSVMSLTSYWRFVFGAILAVIVIFFPRGLMGLLDARRAAAS